MNVVELLWQQGRTLLFVSSLCFAIASGEKEYQWRPSLRASTRQPQTRIEQPSADQRAIAITGIESNAQDYPHATIPAYAKLEITFTVDNTVAGNFQLPYDPDPPNGIDQNYVNHQGISVDALFLPPSQTDWTSAYQQPAFYYQSFADQIKVDNRMAEREWYLPTGQFAWKVRFAPNTPGIWHYKLTARDVSGYTETVPYTFTVSASTDPGFIHVSAADPRYFEFDDGSVFYGLGFNQDIALSDPVLNGEASFHRFQQNHVNLLRIWISSLYGVAWNRYLGGRNLYDGYLPRSALLPFYDPVNQRYTMTMRLDYEPDGDTGWFDACRFEFWDDPEAVKQNTDYRLRIKYRGVDITGPRNTSSPAYGFVGKLDYGWHPDCYESGAGTVVTNYGLNNEDWQTIEGVWHSGNNNFLPRLYMGLENVTGGKVYVDSVSVQEVLANGQYGPEIMVESLMEYELHFPQAESYAFDKLVTMAEKNGVYLKVVLMDKGDNIYFKFKDNGDFVLDSADNLDGFYGVGYDKYKRYDVLA
ncbi:MAG TPA: hypothetical protein PKE45_14535, partial [Caldilineaceae bacterium]|nr:hypothetical protein [Caldilineaceae bacterium]